MTSASWGTTTSMNTRITRSSVSFQRDMKPDGSYRSGMPLFLLCRDIVRLSLLLRFRLEPGDHVSTNSRLLFTPTVGDVKCDATEESARLNVSWSSFTSRMKRRKTLEPQRNYRSWSRDHSLRRAATSSDVARWWRNWCFIHVRVTL